MALLTHEEADKAVAAAMGAPTSQAMESFRSFMSGAGGKGFPQPAKTPTFPREQIKRLPLKAV